MSAHGTTAPHGAGIRERARHAASLVLMALAIAALVAQILLTLAPRWVS